jgi:integrase
MGSIPVSGTDWPVMSADERDLRMKWLCRMFAWLHRQKWIPDDPSTGLRRESVLTKAQRAQADAGRKDREEFTAEELGLIFSRPWFSRGAGIPTKEGTFREFQPFHSWLPLLGAYTGGRIGELTQLHLEDVACTEGGIWFIDINKTLDKASRTSGRSAGCRCMPGSENWGFRTGASG